MTRIGLKNRLLVAVCSAVALTLVALIAGFNVILGRVLDRDARDLARSHATAALATLDVTNGRLRIGEAPDQAAGDAYVWVMRGSRTIEQPRAPATIDRAARSLAGSGTRFVDVPATDTRLYAAPVAVNGVRLGTVVAGISLAPYEQTRHAALLASLVLGGVIMVLVLVAARWLLDASLRPVVRMTRQAAQWSEHHPEHRFALGPPHDELTELAATLDGLLERLAAGLRRERLFSAEISHELRTPLARVLAESELALRRERAPAEYREALELIRRSAAQLARTVDALVAAARYEAGGERGTADAHAVAEGAARACTGLAAERHLDLSIGEPPRPLRVGIDGDLAERILQPVVENACRYGATGVRVEIGGENATVVYTIEDDGPGIADDDHDRIFEPGVRGGAHDARTDQGAGLGLSLARRLARSVDGDVLAAPSVRGARFLIRLPAA
ncbi:MAG TPA: HAMP domain-containing sensor histidine kinase [Gaiellaceae bacterium]|jgi:signal transduction histidine kinase